MRHIILHAFQYKLSDIIKELPMIREQGFTDVQISPIQPLKQDNGPWWVLYQPTGFTIGNEMIGSKEELATLCEEANKLGIGIICDVILNHTAGKDDGSIEPHELVDSNLKNPEYWKIKEAITDWKNREEVITKSMGLPGLKLSNLEVQAVVFKFLCELLECGVTGFRYDAAKNIELPDEGSTFWENIPREFDGKEIFNYAEIIFEEKALLDRYSKYVNILSEGSCSDKNKMVTFVESHDSFFEFKYTAKMGEEDIAREWEHLLSFSKEWSVLYYCRPWTNWWKSTRIREINQRYK